MNVGAFRKIVWNFYKKHKRDLAWRRDTSPYSIAVSEIMLQQTQVKRVEAKYASWMKQFPDWNTLAQASIHEVLGEWKGLGYNRRGLALHSIAQRVAEENSNFPTDPLILEKFPHIGPNTARSIAAFAYNTPVVFIETNIRTVFIHHFFNDKANISDKNLLPLIEKALDKKRPREWYWALMDYGSYLKRTVGNFSRQSKHYKKQKAFKGSNREFRSKILSLIHEKPRSERELERIFCKKYDTKILRSNLKNLQREGFLTSHKKLWKIA